MGGEGAKKGRPEALHVDEANANAAKMLFLDEDDALQEDNIMLMQLPAVLRSSSTPWTRFSARRRTRQPRAQAPASRGCLTDASERCRSSDPAGCGWRSVVSLSAWI